MQTVHIKADIAPFHVDKVLHDKQIPIYRQGVIVGNAVNMQQIGDALYADLLLNEYVNAAIVLNSTRHLTTVTLINFELVDK